MCNLELDTCHFKVGDCTVNALQRISHSSISMSARQVNADTPETHITGYAGQETWATCPH